jgi:putative ABC transport system permease protein
MLGRTLSDELKKKAGDTLQIEGEDFTVIGVYESGNMVENRAATVPLHDLQEIMDRIGQVTELQIALRKDLPDLQAAMSRLRKEIEGLQNEKGASLGLMALPTEQYVTSDNQMRLAHAMAWVTSGIALIVGSIGVLNTMIVSVLERTQEIGILRAIGWRKSRIVRMILAESFSLSIVGAILGTALAALLMFVLTQFSGAQGLVRGEITPRVIAIGFTMAVLVAFVGGTYPALRGAALPPTEALRYE